MQIRPREIPPSGRDVRGDEPTDILLLDPGDSVRPAGTVAYALRLQVAGHELVASGRVSAKLAMQCVRCADVFEREVVESDFLCAVPFESADEEVDLTPEMREAIILALSAHPVCKPECKGLCARCGQNLNQGPCTCPAEQDQSWSALDGLRL
jgi:uncharacterized protein